MKKRLTLLQNQIDTGSLILYSGRVGRRGRVSTLAIIHTTNRGEVVKEGEAPGRRLSGGG